jgi:hypothetical protein
MKEEAPVMRFRVTIIALAVVLTLGAAKKNVATSKAENEDLILTVTLHPDPADIKEFIGDDLGGHYIVAEVNVEPKFGKDIVVDHDDFYLRTDKDGERTRPYAASQIAGSGALIVTHEQTRTASPGWQNTQIPVVRPPAAPGIGSGSETDTSSAKATPQEDKDKKENPLKKLLESKVLPQGKTKEPVKGLLYFPMEKQKMKDLEIVYGGQENRIRLRFKAT